MAETDFSLVDDRGRKHLTLQERTRFLNAVRGDPRPEVQTFALTLVHTGCRISEALALRPDDVDLEAVDLRTRMLKRSPRGRKAPLWPFSRPTE